MSKQKDVRDELYKCFGQTVQHVIATFKSEEPNRELCTLVVMADQSMRSARRLEEIGEDAHELRTTLDTAVAEMQEVVALIAKVAEHAPAMAAAQKKGSG